MGILLKMSGALCLMVLNFLRRRAVLNLVSMAAFIAAFHTGWSETAAPAMKSVPVGAIVMGSTAAPPAEGYGVLKTVLGAAAGWAVQEVCRFALLSAKAFILNIREKGINK
jgi:hypothetical protein